MIPLSTENIRNKKNCGGKRHSSPPPTQHVITIYSYCTLICTSTCHPGLLLICQKRMLQRLKSVFNTKPLVKPQLPTQEVLFSGVKAILHSTGRAPGIKVGKSKIPNAGSGVIVTDGIIKAGSVVSLYSGEV